MALLDQITRRPRAEWLSLDPVLPREYLGIESDFGKGKEGNGVLRWSQLAYVDVSMLTHENDPTAHDASQIASGDPTAPTLAAWMAAQSSRYGVGEFPLKSYGAALDGVTDDASAWFSANAAAVAAGGGVITWTGDTFINSNVTLSSTVGFRGSGGHLDPTKAASRVLCGSSAAGITIAGEGGFFEHCLIDGDGVANYPLKVDGAYAGMLFVGVRVRGALLDNITVETAQNCTWVRCETDDATRDNLVVHDGAGGQQFFGFESNNAGRHALRIHQTGAASPGGYSQPYDLSFFGGIFERTLSDNPVIALEASSSSVLFQMCTAHSSTGGTTPLISLASGGEVAFIEPILSAAAARTIGFQVASGTTLILDGGNVNAPYFTTAAIDILSGGIVKLKAPPRGGATLLSGTSSKTAIATGSDAWIDARSMATGDVMLAGRVTGEAGRRWRVDEQDIAFGDGSDFAVGTRYGRDSSGNARITLPATTNSVTTTGAIKPGRFASGSRPSAATVGEGGVIFDSTIDLLIASDGTNWLPTDPHHRAQNRSGWYHAPAAANVVTAAPFLDGIHLVPIDVMDMTIDRIGIEVTTAIALSAPRLGIYDAGGTLVVDAGTIDGTTTGYKEKTISVAVKAGRYYLCFVNQGAACTVRAGTSAHVASVGHTTGATIAQYAISAMGASASASGALPGSVTFASGYVNAPRLVIRAA